jgi:hypothetical protein
MHLRASVFLLYRFHSVELAGLFFGVLFPEFLLEGFCIIQRLMTFRRSPTYHYMFEHWGLV